MKIVYCLVFPKGLTFISLPDITLFRIIWENIVCKIVFLTSMWQSLFIVICS